MVLITKRNYCLFPLTLPVDPCVHMQKYWFSHNMAHHMFHASPGELQRTELIKQVFVRIN